LEGCIPVEAGLRRLLRFTWRRATSQRGSRFRSASQQSLFEYRLPSPLSFRIFSIYRLLNSSGVPVAVGKKMVLPGKRGALVIDAAADAGYNCNNQGIQAGWSDIYGPRSFASSLTSPVFRRRIHARSAVGSNEPHCGNGRFQQTSPQSA